MYAHSPQRERHTVLVQQSVVAINDIRHTFSPGNLAAMTVNGAANSVYIREILRTGQVVVSVHQAIEVLVHDSFICLNIRQSLTPLKSCWSKVKGIGYLTFHKRKNTRSS